MPIFEMVISTPSRLPGLEYSHCLAKRRYRSCRHHIRIVSRIFDGLAFSIVACRDLHNSSIERGQLFGRAFLQLASKHTNLPKQCFYHFNEPVTCKAPNAGYRLS